MSVVDISSPDVDRVLSEGCATFRAPNQWQGLLGVDSDEAGGAWNAFVSRAAVNPSMDAAGKTSCFSRPGKQTSFHFRYATQLDARHCRSKAGSRSVALQTARPEEEEL
jgi:hypothetical protein